MPRRRGGWSSSPAPPISCPWMRPRPSPRCSAERILRLMRQTVPSRVVLWAGYALAALVLAWLFTGGPALGLACAVLGGLYSAISILLPGWMPRLEVEGLPKPSPAVLLWSHRLLGAAGIPLWIAAWRNRVPHIPFGILMPIGVGIAVAITAELLTDRRQSRRT